MSYLVLDLETTNKNKGEDAIGDFSASPFHPENEIVIVGAKFSSGAPYVYSNGDINSNIIKHYDIIVGHNIKFDFHYMMRHIPGFHEAMPEMHIWDTQLAEYLLTGQQAKWATLDSLSEKYGGTLKDNCIKDYWESGVDTEDIPRELLEEYCLADVCNTEIVFLEQMKLATEMGMLSLIRTQMNALLATIEMEYNGLAFDKATAFDLSKDLREELKTTTDYLKAQLGGIPGVVPNPDSKDQLSLLLFGGQHTYQIVVPQTDEDGKPVLYKTGAKKGTQRFVKEDLTVEVPRLFIAQEKWKTKKAGVYSTADDVLQELLPKSLKIIQEIMKYRKLSKDVGTYYEGYGKLVWPDGFIHGKLNMCQTNTGRLSSSSPNLQNLSGDD